MAGYSIGYYAVKTEAVWGTSPITAAGDTAYWLGVLPPNPGLIPWAEKSYWRGVPLPLYETHATLYRNVLLPKGTITVALLDGVPLWYAFGKTTNTGAGAPYTHALAFRSGTGAAMADPPSFTLHRELVDPAGVLTDDRLQVTGLRVEDCLIRASKDANGGYLTATLGLVGKQHDDTTAFSLTNKPSSRIASATPFNLNQLTTYTVGGTAVAGLRGLELWWRRPITPEYQFRTVAGANAGHLVYAHLFGDVDGPYCRLSFEPESFSATGFQDLDADAPAKDLSFVFTRAANDTITFTGTNWHPALGREPIWTPTGVRPVSLEGPLESLTCSVTDSLAGATHYA